MRSALVSVFGWPTPLFHGDTAVLDRWLWLRQRLPISCNSERLLDIGCGSGAFTIGAALRGYQALGLSWDPENQGVAIERARMCKANSATFEVQDIRALEDRSDLYGKFDVVVLCEVIEHIIDDERLIRDAARCLKPGGRVLLTTPNLDLRPIDPSHEGPFPAVEDGGHVRKGYSASDLLRLCERSRLICDSISYCTGLLSQKITRVHFLLARVHPLLGWCAIHPLRVLPPVVDRAVTGVMRYPYYSICLEAHRPL